MRIAFTMAALCLPATIASAQIISTMLPIEPPQPGGTSRAAAGQVMAGYASWEYGTDFYDRIVIESHGGTFAGSLRSGFIVAADFPFKLNQNVILTAGGWYNRGGTRTAHDPAHNYHGLAGEINVNIPDRVLTEQSSFSSVYGSVFYKWVGVQAGIVPVQIRQTLTVAPNAPVVSNRTQMDFDVFGVFRYTDTDFWVPVTFTIGVGGYRYSARDASLLVNGLYDEGTAQPASMAASGFGNISLSLTRHLAFDFSVWATGANNTRLNDSQGRVTVGLGITF
jgi:hypothetical protein